jgi:RND family efflux transporter MFP subunit
VTALVLAMSLLLIECTRPEGAQDPSAEEAVPPPCVRITTVATRMVNEEVVLRADLVAHRQTLVMPQSSGWLDELNVDQGSRVVGGETVLATLRAESMDLNVTVARAGVEMALAGQRQAELQLQNAQTELTRLEALHERGVATGQQLDQVQTTVEAAEEMVRQAQANVRMLRTQTRQAEDMADELDIVAPFDGVILQRMVEQGQLIFPATPMFLLIDPSQLRVEANVPEFQADRVVQGMPCIVDLESGDHMETTLAFVSPGLDMVSRSKAVWAVIDNAQGRLSHGGTATLRIQVERRELPIIPRHAVARMEGDRAFVFVLNEDGRTVREAPVRVGILQDDSYPALESIEAGMDIVEYGWTRLAEGSLVRATRELTCGEEEGTWP